MPEIDPQLVEPTDAIERSIPMQTASDLVVGDLGDGDQRLVGPGLMMPERQAFDIRMAAFAAGDPQWS